MELRGAIQKYPVHSDVHVSGASMTYVDKYPSNITWSSSAPEL